MATSNRHALVAVGVIWTLANSAIASDMIGGGRSGVFDSESSTTATMHCERMTGPQREACMRQVREGTNSKAPSSGPGAGDRTPGAAGPADGGTGATGIPPGEIGSSRTDIETGSVREGSGTKRTPSDRTPPATGGMQEPRKKESSRAPVSPAPAESRTPEEAAARAADPKAPSGALIIDTPSGKLPSPPSR